MASEPVLDPNRSGPLPALSACHSRYAPLKEAERHLDTVLEGKRPGIVFILGGGLNFLGAAIGKRLPHAIRVSLQPCADFEGHEVCLPEFDWNPASPKPLRAVIQAALATGRAAAGIAVVEWLPVLGKFNTEADSIRSVLARCLNEESANSATTGYWAARWLRNCLRYAVTATNVASLENGSCPLLIACAGPSLMDQILEIRAMRDGICLWALASAVPALLGAGIKPDLAISTDPGYWNDFHVRAAYDGGVPLAVTPSAYAASVVLERSLLVTLNTGLSFERAAIAVSDIPFVPAAPSGSAAGTALSLALRSTTGVVALAGYDLAARRLDDHAKPYAFDALDTARESRLSPAQAIQATRVFDGFTLVSGSWRGSKPFSTYASTITVPTSESGRVVRLGDSPVETGIQRGSIKDITIPTARRPERVGLAKLDRKRSGSPGASLVDMLDRLGAEAAASARLAVHSGSPLPFEAALYFKAVAPRSSAALIAAAARGEADAAELERVVADARSTAASLSEAG